MTDIIFFLCFVCAVLTITCIYLYIQMQKLSKLATLNIINRGVLEKMQDSDHKQLINCSKLAADNHQRLNEVVNLVKKLDGGLKNYLWDKNKRLGANQKIK